MICPVLKDEEFLANVRAALETREERQLDVWWVGQMGFLVAWCGEVLLLDPYLSDSLTRKYEGTDKPHVRMTERVVDPAQLDFVRLVTASHAHTDHLDPDTLRPLAAANPSLTLVCPTSIRRLAEERSGLPHELIVGMANGTRFELGPWSLRAIPSAHEALDCDTQGNPLYLGFLIQVGPWRLYHSGDTVRYPGLAETLRAERLDLAFLPINGADPSRRVAGNLSGAEAAELANDAEIQCVVPGHYEMFQFNTASPDPFREACASLSQDARILRAGERLSLLHPEA